MLWFIYDGPRFVGTVVAATEADALLNAAQKFGFNWMTNYRAQPRRR